MKYERSADGKTLNVALVGEVDATNVADIEDMLLRETETASELIFDLKDLEYISSAGLRVLLQMQKIMKSKGDMVIKNASEDIMDIFRVTGFIRLLHIE